MVQIYSMALCSCQVRNKKKLIFFINGEPLARFPMLLLYNFVFSLLLLIIPSSSLKVIKVPSDFNMLVIIHQHISNEISDYFFIKHPKRAKIAIWMVSPNGLCDNPYWIIYFFLLVLRYILLLPVLIVSE